MKRFRKVQTSDRDLNLVQDNVKASLDSLATIPLLGGKLLSQCTLATGSNNVPHGLGRNYVSALCGLPSAGSLTTATSPDRSKWITVIASAPCTADLFVW